MGILKKKSMLIIFGPTGAGKTDCADTIACHIPAEIINMDVGQFYAPLSIGTAKPQWQKSTVPHHFFDIINEPVDYTVVTYRKALQAKLHEIWGRNALPIIVGGSGFYLRSLFFPPCSHKSEVGADDDKESSWEHLDAIDPKRAACIHRNDSYRIERALKIATATGQLPSTYVSAYEPLANYSIIFLTRERTDLYNRINQRVLEMIDQGWEEEVAALLKTPWNAFLKKKKLIGYNELLSYKENPNEPLASTIKSIQQKTRHYAKRQHTFWRKLKKQLQQAQSVSCKGNDIHAEIEDLNLTFTDLDLYIKRLLQKPFFNLWKKDE